MEPSVPLNDGTSIPWLIYGSGTALRDKDASKQISNAIRAGYRHIDCAQMYRNEESVGQGIAESGVPREALYITTKLMPVPEGQTAVDALRESLRKMKLAYVDLFLIHEPVGHKDLKTTWKEMERCKSEGLARSVGVSNFRIQDFEAILDDTASVPAVNQIEYHPYVYAADVALMTYMSNRGIVAVSFTGQAPIVRVKNGPLDSVLDRIARRLSGTAGKTVTAGQVLQLWLRKQNVPCISTTAKIERLREYLDVVNLPGITDEEEALMNETGSRVHHRFFVGHYTH